MYTEIPEQSCPSLTFKDSFARIVARMPRHRLRGIAESEHCEPACPAHIVLAPENKYGQPLPF